MKKIHDIMREFLKEESQDGKPRKVGIVGHVNPDGDCVGSCLGLYWYLSEQYPVEVQVFMDPYAKAMHFMEEGSQMNPAVDPSDRYAALFILDCADTGRIGAGKALMEQADLIVCIDHHISNQGFGDLQTIRPEASSACEVLYELLDPERIGYRTAECLYTGIVHDTGVFAYSCVSPRTMQIAGELMKAGFDAPGIIAHTFYEKTMESQQLLARALKRCQWIAKKEAVISWITREDIREEHADEMDTEGIVEALRNTAGADAAIFLHETEPGVYRLNLRSKERFNVNLVATEFGGGGHVRASGATLRGELHELINRLEQELLRQL